MRRFESAASSGISLMSGETLHPIIALMKEWEVIYLKAHSKPILGEIAPVTKAISFFKSTTPRRSAVNASADDLQQKAVSSYR